jgi:hypothetical protein
MRQLFVAIVLLPLFCGISQAKVYKCTDGQGNEVYNSEGGPNCTLLYSDKEEEEAITPEEVQGTSPSSPQDVSASQPDGRSLTFVERRNDVQGDNLYARGSVKNNGSHFLRAVRIVVRFYDGQDEFISMESSYTQPQDISPGETAEYEVVTTHDPRIEKIRTTAHWAERKE